MKETYFNQCILCAVSSCKFHGPENKCHLGKIFVTANKEQTHCASYQKND